MKVWVLTSEHNDYDQHGEYFHAVFASKPTAEMMNKAGVGSESAAHLLKTGGGRRKSEDSWYWLREVEAIAKAQGVQP
jgi:hypothetical protein